jgi:signal peptidase II
VRELQERGVVAALSRDWSRPRLQLIIAGTAAVVVAVDQLTKSLAVHFLRDAPVYLVGPVRLALTFNSGAAFSLARGLTTELVIVGVALIAVVVVLGRSASTTATAIAVGLILGGAVGNLVDRLVRSNGGSVIDFIDLRYWPTFNVADACIVCGAVLLVFVGYRRRTP